MLRVGHTNLNKSLKPIALLCQNIHSNPSVQIVKKKLAVVSPMILFGNSILYETGDDLDEDEQRSYAVNAAKVRTFA